MRIVKRFLAISMVLGVILILLVCSVFAEAKLFSCDTEDCSYNGNTSKWDCQYVGCPVMPAWINQTNNTIINTTQVNVSDCNLTEMEGYWDGYVTRIDKRFNCSSDYNDCQDTLRSCRNQLETASNMLGGMVNQSYYDVCLGDASKLREQASAAESGSWLKLFIGLLVGAGGTWYFMKKPEANRTQFMTTPGEVTYNPRAITQDTQIARQQSRIEELEAVIKKRILPQPRQPNKPGKKGATENPFGEDESDEK